jgi:hypothetical protein
MVQLKWLIQAKKGAAAVLPITTCDEKKGKNQQACFLI